VEQPIDKAHIHLHKSQVTRETEQWSPTWPCSRYIRTTTKCWT